MTDYSYGEQCDDGNNNNDDGCSINCTYEVPSCSAVNYNPQSTYA
jgi:cysteine-rich repeat protein